MSGLIGMGRLLYSGTRLSKMLDIMMLLDGLLKHTFLVVDLPRFPAIVASFDHVSDAAPFFLSFSLVIPATSRNKFSVSNRFIRKTSEENKF